ncbi:MAG: hypothetical protein JOS17DRAFT_487842 [Linnemannia elongata]|nr:MAG: hypothetical protein JOS17DRAFT_487842 [Linnemannia elongata]
MRVFHMFRIHFISIHVTMSISRRLKNRGGAPSRIHLNTTPLSSLFHFSSIAYSYLSLSFSRTHILFLTLLSPLLFSPLHSSHTHTTHTHTHTPTMHSSTPPITLFFFFLAV